MKETENEKRKWRGSKQVLNSKRENPSERGWGESSLFSRPDTY